MPALTGRVLMEDVEEVGTREAADQVGRGDGMEGTNVDPVVDPAVYGGGVGWSIGLTKRD
jgi:hypothetical protein